MKRLIEWLVRLLATKFSGTGSGVDKSKGLTAISADIARNKTAAVDGEVITGSAIEIAAGTGTVASTLVEEDGEIIMRRNVANRVIFREGSQYCAYVDNPDVGDATAADVKTGTTFTSASGVAITGTMETDIVAEVPSVSITNSGDIIKITTTKTIGELLAFNIFTKSDKYTDRPYYYKYAEKKIYCQGYDWGVSVSPTFSGNTMTFTFDNDLSSTGCVYVYIVYRIGG